MAITTHITIAAPLPLHLFRAPGDAPPPKPPKMPHIWPANHPPRRKPGKPTGGV